MTQQKTDDLRKQQIRDAATRCFVRRGFAATRLLDIAREAGLSKGGVYFHYRAKEQLFHNILDVQLKALTERWRFEPDTNLSADRTLAQVVSAHVHELQAETDETRLCNLLVTMAVQEPEFRRKLAQAFEVTRRLYESVICRGIAEGVFVDGDPAILAHGVVALAQGLAAASAVDPDGKLPISQLSAARIALCMLGADPKIADEVVEEVVETPSSEDVSATTSEASSQEEAAREPVAEIAVEAGGESVPVDPAD